MMQFQENAHTDRTTDGTMDRPYFMGPFRLPQGVQKRCFEKYCSCDKTSYLDMQLVNCLRSLVLAVKLPCGVFFFRKNDSLSELGHQKFIAFLVETGSVTGS